MFKKTLFAVATAVLISACANQNYDYTSAGQQHDVIQGTIIAKQQVQIATDTSTGEIIGFAVGATAGSTIGGGDNEKIVGSVIGALAGAYAGKKLQQNSQKAYATEYMIEQPNGNVKAVVSTDMNFQKNDAVFVILSNPPVIRLQKDIQMDKTHDINSPKQTVKYH